MAFYINTKDTFKAQCMEKVQLHVHEWSRTERKKNTYNKMSTTTTLQEQILANFWNAPSVVHIREILKYIESFQEVKLMQY
jgi:hypothetical protein